MKVLKLTTSGGKVVYINAAYITTFMPDGTGTIFFLCGGDTQRVTESIGHVVDTLTAAYND